MKNFELIALLSELPAGAEIWVSNEEAEEIGRALQVTQDESGDIVIRDFIFEE